MNLSWLTGQVNELRARIVALEEAAKPVSSLEKKGQPMPKASTRIPMKPKGDTSV